MEELQQQLTNALKLAGRALNTAPRFQIPSLPKEQGDSYKVAAIIDAAIARAIREPVTVPEPAPRSPRNTPRARVVIDKLSDGSEVAAVIFGCDYETGNLVQIDCATQPAAQELCDHLNRAALDILVTAS